jgi:uncharacterized protein YxjI
MVICHFCNLDNVEDSNFCVACGNNLKKQGHFTPVEAVQYQATEFQVEQKILALTATYKISDMNGRVFMEAKRTMTSPFSPKIVVKTPQGVPLGVIKGNIFKTSWKIIDAQGNVHAEVRFPFFMFISKTFKIWTEMGLFRSGRSIFEKKFEAFAPDGRLSFVVDKKILAIRDKFKIRSDGLLSPFVTCLAAVCIDQKFHSK